MLQMKIYKMSFSFSYSIVMNCFLAIRLGYVEWSEGREKKREAN